MQQPTILMLRSTTTSPFSSSIQTSSSYFLRFSKPKLSFSSFSSSFSSSSTISHSHNQNQQKQSNLLSFLHNHPTNHKTTHESHSYFLTSGSLHHQNKKSILLFNALLRSYSLGDNPIKALSLYKQFLYSHFLSPFSPFPQFDSFTYSFLIKTSVNLNHPIFGMQVQALTMKTGFQFHVYVQTALVDMYIGCGNLIDAKKVFDEMPERNSVTWNVMITGLVRLGELETACALFEQMGSRNVVAWTGLIDGFTRAGKPSEAIALFRKMVRFDRIDPSEITILAILPAIWNKGDIKMCQSVHAYGLKKGFIVLDIRVTNALIDAYAKCGCISSASRFFEEIENKNLVTWTSIISAFAMYGFGKEAMGSFERMERNGLKANRVTFLSVLNACSHGGLVEEGVGFFEKMVKDGEVSVDVKHYGCLIDMLGRAGRLEEAEKLALGIPSDVVNVVIWRILLGACSFHGGVEIGERVSLKILEFERGYGGDYVLMSNIFSGVGKFGDAERFRCLMDERNAFKVPGRSLV